MGSDCHQPWTIEKGGISMITSLEITLTDGTKYKMNMPETIKDINEGKKALFMFDNCELYSGYSNGLVDEEGVLCRRAVHKRHHAMRQLAT